MTLVVVAIAASIESHTMGLYCSTSVHGAEVQFGAFLSDLILKAVLGVVH